MSTATIRDLRNRGGEIVGRAAAGETITITKSGTPVAQLVPLEKPRLTARELVEHWRTLPRVDAEELRRDLDAVTDPSL